jgi:hypothetical protein
MGDPNESVWERCFLSALVGRGGDTVAARLDADKALAAIIERWPRDRIVYTRDELDGLQLELLRRVQMFVNGSVEGRAGGDLKRAGRYDAANVLSAFIRFVHSELDASRSRDNMRYEVPNVRSGIPFPLPEREEDHIIDGTKWISREVHERALQKTIDDTISGMENGGANRYAILLAAAREAFAAYDDPAGLKPGAEGRPRLATAMDALAKVCEEAT